MTIKTLDAGGLAILNGYFKDVAAPANFTLQLYCAASPPTLADGDTNAGPAGTTIASGNGADAKTLTLAAATVSTVSNIPQVAWPQQTFTLTGTQANPIQGYQVLAGTTAIFEENFATPVTAGSGVTLNITPTFQLGNGTPS
jgi:hypothetical protein